MRIKDILVRLPGITSRFVYYLEQQGYIKPQKEQHGKRDYRIYSEKDFHEIAKTWRYCSQNGMPPKEAYKRALKKEKKAFYIIGKLDSARAKEYQERLKGLNDIVAIYALIGKPDLLIEVIAPEDEIYLADTQIRNFLDFIPGYGSINVLRVLETKFTVPFERRREGMLAWLLIKVPAKQSGGVAQRLRNLRQDGVTGAWTLYGDMDVLARIEVENQAQLDELVMVKIQGIEQVEFTTTYLAVTSIPEMCWER